MPVNVTIARMKKIAPCFMLFSHTLFVCRGTRIRLRGTQLNHSNDRAPAAGLLPRGEKGRATVRCNGGLGPGPSWASLLFDSLGDSLHLFLREAAADEDFVFVNLLTHDRCRNHLPSHHDSQR